MATMKKAEMAKERNRIAEMGRKMALAYVGAFGVAGDESRKLLETFVKRGEVMEKDMRHMVNQNRKDVRKFATQMQKEQKAAVARAEKTVKKAVKRVESLA